MSTSTSTSTSQFLALQVSGDPGVPEDRISGVPAQHPDQAAADVAVGVASLSLNSARERPNRQEQVDPKWNNTGGRGRYRIADRWCVSRIRLRRWIYSLRGARVPRCHHVTQEHMICADSHGPCGRLGAFIAECLLDEVSV
jgi:hypothetical protein